MRFETPSFPAITKNGPLFWIARHLKDTFSSGILIPIVFFVVLSYYNILLYLSNYYTIFDLGLAYRTMYLFITTHTFVNWPVPYALVTAKPYTKLIYVPLSLTLLIYRGPTTVLVDMIAAVSAGGYAIFRIFKIRTSSTNMGLMAQMMYFLYPATYGLMAHGGNFMIFFTPLLLLSFMYYLEEKHYKSGVFALLSMLTFSFATIVVPLFYLITLIIDKRFIKKNLTNTEDPDNNVALSVTSRLTKHKYYFLIVIFAVGLIVFVYEASLYSLVGLVNAARISTPGTGTAASTSGTSLFDTIFAVMPQMKWNFFFDMLYPLVFIPLLTPYAFFILPFFLLVFYANFFPYYSVNQQYPSMVSVFIFVGLVHFFRRHFRKSFVKKMAPFLLITSIYSFAMLSPFSIGNFEQGNIAYYSHVTPLDLELNKGLSLIPLNSSVFIQNDIPQLMDRATVYMPGYYENQSVEFAVIIPPNMGFPSDQYSGYTPYWANFFAHNTSYGIYENIGGILIYKLHFYSNPVFTAS